MGDHVLGCIMTVSGSARRGPALPKSIKIKIQISKAWWIPGAKQEGKVHHAITMIEIFDIARGGTHRAVPLLQYDS